MSELNLVDSHCHLDFDDFGTDFSSVLDRARENGVARMLTICTRITKFDQVLKIAESADNIRCTVGIHPHEAANEPEVDVTKLAELAQHPKVVGIGEAGLDFHYDLSPRDIQARSFRVHIEAARETGLPLVIHSREAEGDTAAILEEEMGKGAFKPLLHCFSSGPELARVGVELGGYVSFSGILTFPKSDDIREIAKGVPRDRLLVETDAPYLAPKKWRGKRNEPSYVVNTAEVLAETIGVSMEEIAEITTENAFRCFSKMPRLAA